MSKEESEFKKSIKRRYYSGDPSVPFVLNEMYDLLENLNNFYLKTNNDGIKCLAMPEGVRQQNETFLASGSIFVPSRYEYLWRMIESADPPSQRENPFFALLGVQGIGQLFFAFFLFWNLMKKEVSFIFKHRIEPEDQELFFCKFNKNTIPYNYDVKIINQFENQWELDPLEIKDFWYIVNLDSPSYFLVCHCQKTIVLQDAGWFNYMNKQHELAVLPKIVKFFPMWTLKELNDCYLNRSPQNRVQTNDQIQEKYDLVGGIARDCLIRYSIDQVRDTLKLENLRPDLFSLLRDLSPFSELAIKLTRARIIAYDVDRETLDLVAERPFMIASKFVMSKFRELYIRSLRPFVEIKTVNPDPSNISHSCSELDPCCSVMSNEIDKLQRTGVIKQVQTRPLVSAERFRKPREAIIN